MCIQGVCTANSNAPVTSCPFGDDIVVNQQVISGELPSTQMSCSAVFNYISNTIGEFPLSYCSDPNFNFTCCSTCKSILVI